MIEDKWWECCVAQYRYDEKLTKTRPEVIFLQQHRLVRIRKRNQTNRVWI